MKKFPLALCTLLAAACGPPEEPPAAEIRPVRTLVIEDLLGGETVKLTGRIEAKEEVSLAFRVGQRMLERKVNVGDRIEPGQLIARLEFDRQRTMLERGVSPRARFDSAQAARQATAAHVDAAQAQLATAREQRTFTDLFADSDGVVTAVGAEPGEVVAAGQMIVRVAREGGRDAVFDVPGRVKEAAGGLDPEVTVTLTSDANVKAKGRVREVSPQANPVTRNFAVRVGLIEPPPALRLGSTVTGSIELAAGGGIRVPASALTAAQGAPAVWVLDPASNTVSLRPVVVEQSGTSEVVLSEGVAPDEIVVTAGVQTLRPGQKVRLLQAAP